MLFRNGSITPWTYENLFTGTDHSKQDLLTHSLAWASFYVKVSPKKLQKAITSQLPTCTLLFYFFSDSLDISLISPELCTYTHTWTHTYVSTLADCLFLLKKKFLWPVHTFSSYAKSITTLGYSTLGSVASPEVSCVWISLHLTDTGDVSFTQVESNSTQDL